MPGFHCSCTCLLSCCLEINRLLITNNFRVIIHKYKFAVSVFSSFLFLQIFPPNLFLYIHFSPNLYIYIYIFMLGGGARVFQNWWKWRGLKIVARRGEKGGGGLQMEGCHVVIYWVFPGGSSWSSIEEKSWFVCLSFVNKHLLQNNCLRNMRSLALWHCDSFNSVDSYNSCIN